MVLCFDRYVFEKKGPKQWYSRLLSVDGKKGLLKPFSLRSLL